MKDWQSKFLKALRDRPIVSRACRISGVSRAAAYRARAKAESDPSDSFNEDWDEAIEEGLDVVEEDLLDLGIGEKKGNVGALIYYLKARRYEKRTDPNAPTKLVLVWGDPSDKD